MMLVLSGTVDVTKRSARGTPSRLAVIKSGASVGEMSMLDGAPRNATCSALEEVEAGVLTRLAIERLIREHPAVGAKLLVKLTQTLAQRLRNTSNQLVKARAAAAPGAPDAVKAGLKRRASDW
jgi:CRP-like cAMP-binding protein